MQDKNILLSQNIKIKLYRSLYTDYFKRILFFYAKQIYIRLSI